MTLCNIEQPKVLVVDTDRMRRVIMVYECRKAGFAVLATEKVGDALSAMNIFFPDVVLTELDLPDEDGFSLIAAIRSKRVNRHTTIIAMANNEDEETRLRALEAGANKFIRKPVSPATLIALLNDLLLPAGEDEGGAKHIFI